MPARIARAENKPARKRPAPTRAEQKRRLQDPHRSATQSPRTRRVDPVRAPTGKKPGSKGTVARRKI